MAGSFFFSTGETDTPSQPENPSEPEYPVESIVKTETIRRTVAPTLSDVDHFDEREYTFTYVDAKKVEYTATIRITMSNKQYHPELEKTYPDFSGDQGKDAYTLRHDASFSQKVADGVYWVPANTLGKSSYTNAQIQAMLTKTPEQKQAGIDTLFEALQLFQIGSFYGSDDNVWIWENGYEWEHHKPGYHAVRTNNGCCASCANWLHYILQDDYDEVGYIATNSLSGGHVFNYIKEDGWYYFVDLTTWYAENINVNAIESGKLEDYYNSDYINGNIHRATSMDAFVNYMLNDYINPPGLIYSYQAEDVIALASVWTASGGIEIVYSDTVPITIHHDNATDTLNYRIITAPTKNKDWTRDEDFAFAKLKFK